jgi:hypothetical protein
LVTEVEQQQVTFAGAGKLGELLDRWLDFVTPKGRLRVFVTPKGRLRDRRVESLDKQNESSLL